MRAALRCATLHCTALRCVALPSPRIALRCYVALHCTALHCTFGLHCISIS